MLPFMFGPRFGDSAIVTLQQLTPAPRFKAIVERDPNGPPIPLRIFFDALN
jgi:hypothetical protein